MHFSDLKVDELRCIGRLRTVLNPGVNLVVGNGSGKTTFLDALNLTSGGLSTQTQGILLGMAVKLQG